MASSLQFNSIFEKWTSIAENAASGANSQPWAVSFNIMGDQVQFTLGLSSSYLVHPSVMDLDGKTGMLALGCFAKCLELAALEDGFELHKTEYLSHDSSFLTKFKLTFINTKKCQKGMVDHIFNRWTNRNAYENTELPGEAEKTINEVLSKYSEFLSFSIHKKERNEIARATYFLECLRWNNKVFFNGIFEEIIFPFSKIKDRGIPVGYLGLNQIDQFIFILIGKYEWIKTLSRLIFYPLFAFKNLIVPVQKSSAIFFLSPKINSSINMFEVGKAYQEIWTVLNAQGISFQPISQGLLPDLLFSFSGLFGVSSKFVNTMKMKLERLNSKFGINFFVPTVGARIGISQFKRRLSPRRKTPLKYEVISQPEYQVRISRT